MEFAVPVRTGALIEKDSDRMENIKKKMFKLILQNRYTTYEEACEKFKWETVKDRRRKLCLKFSKKELKKETSIFNRLEPKVITRHTHKKIVSEFSCHTNRYFNSALPYLSRLVNEDHSSKTQ